MSIGDGIRAGMAYVEGVFKDEKMVAGLKRGQAQFKAMAATVKKTGLEIAAAGAAITAPMVVALNTFRKVGAELDDMSKRTGASVKALSELRFAAGQSGTSLEKVEAGLKTMQKTLLGAEQGAAAAVATLDALGLSAEQLRGMAPEDQFALIASQLNRIEDPGMKAAMAMKILGKSGQELLPMIADLQELRTAANELGVTMTPENAAAAAALDDALDLLNKTFEGTRSAVGAAVAPLAVDFLSALTEVSAAATDWVNRNQELVGSVAALGAVAVGAGSGLAGFAGSLNAIVKLFESLVQYKALIGGAFTTLGAAGAIALATVATVLGTIVAATLDWYNTQQQVNRAIEAAGKKQTERDSGALRQDEARYSQLVEKGRRGNLSKAEQDEAREIAGALNLEYGKDTVRFDGKAGKFVDTDASRARLNEAKNGRSVMAISNDVALQQMGLDLAGGRGETGEQIAARQRKLEETQAELDKRRTMIADAGKLGRSQAPSLGIGGAATKSDALGGGVGGAIDWFGGVTRRVGDAAEEMAATLQEQGEKSRDRLRAIDETDDETARLQIEKTKKGTDKELALIDLRRQIEIRQLEQGGLFEGDLLAEMKSKVNAQAEIEAEIARRGAGSNAVASSGTLRGDLAAQQLGGMTIDDKQWETQKQMLARLTEIRDKKNGLTVGA